MNWRWKASITVLATFAIGGVVVGSAAYRAKKAWNTAWDFESQIRYQVNSGKSIGSVSGEEALAVDYLQQIFQDNSELLDKLKAVVKRGITDDKTLQLSQVSSMVVTYRLGTDPATGARKAKDVVAHVLGEFPLGKRKPGFNQDGYFRHLVDGDLWNLGGTVLGMFGRDMIMFAEADVSERQKTTIEALLKRGDILPLADEIRRETIYFTAVFPNPVSLLPVQLKKHVQALVIKGNLSPDKGLTEVVLLTPSPRSAAYAAGILSDLRKIAQVSLLTQWHAIEEPNPWSSGKTIIDTWWSFELRKNLENSTIKKEYNIVRLRSDFDRKMVNISLKMVERATRDLAAMRGTMDEKLDPRLVDDQLFSKKPQHYWSDTHKYGADWPFAGAEAEQAEPVAPAEEAAEPAQPSQANSDLKPTPAST